jgi:lipoate-protein ligase A
MHRNKKITLTESQLRHLVRQTLAEGLFDFLKGGGGKITEKTVSAARQQAAKEKLDLGDQAIDAYKRDKDSDLLTALFKLLQVSVTDLVMKDIENIQKNALEPVSKNTWVIESDGRVTWTREGGDPAKHYEDNRMASLPSLSNGFELKKLLGIEQVKSALTAWMRAAIGDPLKLGELTKPAAGLQKLVKDKELAAEVKKLMARYA